MKKLIISVFTQILPVMLGVYLGFALNNFGESQKIKREKKVFREMLRNEIKENLASIKDVYAYHLKFSKDSDAIRKSPDVKKAFDEYEMRGLRPGFVNQSAYKTGIQTGIIQEFDLELIQVLNRLYTLQENYTTYNEMMMNSFLSRKFPETESEIKNTIQILMMNMNDLDNFEKNLENFYTKVLEDL